MGQTQGKDEDNNDNKYNGAFSPRKNSKDKKDKKKKEKKEKPAILKDPLVKVIFSGFGAAMQIGKAYDKVSESLDPDNWKKKPKLLHYGHFELTGKRQSVNTETSLGLFYCLPNELLAHLSNYLSWKEALTLQASSRGFFLLLQEDLFWKGLYNKAEWKHAIPATVEVEDPFESEPYKPLPPPEPEDCCYKKKFLKRYLMPEEKKARTMAQINELHNRIQKLETTRVEKTFVHDREYLKQKRASDHRRKIAALVCCILIALFLKPVTIFIAKLTIFTFQLPAELFIGFVERFSCWRNMPVTCWGFSSRKTFESFDLVVDTGVRDDYLFCLPTVTMQCFILYIFWALFQIGKLIATFLSVVCLIRVFFGFVERFCQYLLEFKPFSQKDLHERYNRKISEINGYYMPKIKKLQDRIEVLRGREEMRAPRSGGRGCCVQ